MWSATACARTRRATIITFYYKLSTVVFNGLTGVAEFPKMPDGKNVGVNTGVRMGTVANHLRMSQLASNRGIPPASRPFPDAVRRDAGEHYMWNDLASKQ